MRIIAKMTRAWLIDEYSVETLKKTKKEAFGNNLSAALIALRLTHGHKILPALTSERLIEFIDMRVATGADGVTINIDLTYSKHVLEWDKKKLKLPLKIEPVIDTGHSVQEDHGMSTKSKERD